MKKTLLIIVLALCSVSYVSAQAKIKFTKLTENVGTFSESNPVQKAEFAFVNDGDKPLIINQAIASCGCTVPSYPKEPIAPGQQGKIVVTYNGKNKFPGHFKKTITIRTNGVPELTRLYLEGVMTEAK